MPSVKPAANTELAQMRDELKALKAAIEDERTRRLADRAAADEASKTAFEVRVEVQVALGKLTASGAKAIKARGLSLLLAGANPVALTEALDADGDITHCLLCTTGDQRPATDGPCTDINKTTTHRLNFHE